MKAAPVTFAIAGLSIVGAILADRGSEALAFSLGVGLLVVVVLRTIGGSDR